MKKLAVLSLSFLLFACNEKENRVRPAYVLPSDSMAVMLAEVQILNAEYQHRDVRRDKLQPFAVKQFDALFDSVGVSQVRYDSSFSWWSKDPDAMQALLDNTLNILSARVSEVKTRKRFETETEEVTDSASVEQKN
ncbi:MAG: DUF4296 domain-containing protein [Salibacteraceae bacterium]|nr:DUF4296 domain-containing protein [Salibacteraceae bacterium]